MKTTIKILTIFCISLIIGCASTSKSLIGVWELTESNGEFFKDLDIKSYQIEFREDCKYKLDSYIGLASGDANHFGVEGNYELTGANLQITQEDGSKVIYQVKLVDGKLHMTLNKETMVLTKKGS